MHRREFLKCGALGLVTPWGFLQMKNTSKDTISNKPTALDVLSDQRVLSDTIGLTIITKRLQWSPFQKTYHDGYILKLDNGVIVPTVEYKSTIDWQSKYTDDNRLDVITRAIKLHIDSLLKQIELDQWRVVISTAANNIQDITTCKELKCRDICLGIDHFVILYGKRLSQNNTNIHHDVLPNCTPTWQDGYSTIHGILGLDLGEDIWELCPKYYANPHKIALGFKSTESFLTLLPNGWLTTRFVRGKRDSIETTVQCGIVNLNGDDIILGQFI